MSLNIDPHTLDEIAYACFWFEEMSLPEKLEGLDIDLSLENLMHILRKVIQKYEMWFDFFEETERLIFITAKPKHRR